MYKYIHNNNDNISNDVNTLRKLIFEFISNHINHCNRIHGEIIQETEAISKRFSSAYYSIGMDLFPTYNFKW